MTPAAAGPPPVLDPSVRRTAGGRLLVGGSPARLVRLHAAGSAALDRLLTGSPQPGDEALGRRLRDRGLLHPVALGRAAEVTFVLPVRDGGARLPELIESLRQWGAVLVVDDGSTDGSAARAAGAGARVLPNATGTRGPGAARNVGLAAAETEFVAFLDADCRCERDWARPLAALLADDPGLLAAAPRVRGTVGSGAIGRYERARCPLDMGARPALLGPGGRVPYVPSAALVVRRSAALALGGFEPGLRFGEDVDLCWRALAAGWAIRYAPEVAVEHLPRPSVTAFARQRFEYGSSAAELARRHPGMVAPLRLSPRTGLLILAGVGWGRRGAVLALLGQLGWTALRRRDRAAAPALAALAASGIARSGRHLVRAASRDWLPATVLAGALSHRLRPGLAAMLAADATAGLGRDPSLALPSSLALRLIENAAYATGLWRGALRARSAAALLPRIR